MIQLYSNLNSFRCSYYSYFISWDSVRKTTLTSGEIVLYLECALKVEERRRRGGRTNIYVRHLRPNVILYHDINDPLSEVKARIINEDAELTPDILLVVSISLAIDGPRYELKNKLIPAVR